MSILDTLNRSRSGLLELLDITFVRVEGDRVEARMPVTPHVHQPYGVVHGGIYVCLAETLASVGAGIAAGEDKMVFGMEINANHVASARDGTLYGSAKPCHLGRSSHVWLTEIRGDDDRLLSTGRCTVAVVDRKARRGVC